MPLDQILFKMESSISRPTGGIFFNIRGETPSKPGAEDVREKIAFLSSVREKGIVRKSAQPFSGSEIGPKLISSNAGTYGGDILSQKNGNQSSL
jgi:hypothetical protein